jgi:hypothetical protein
MAISLQIRGTPTRVGKLHRRAKTTGAAANTFEAGLAAGADVTAGATVVIVTAGRDAGAVADNFALGTAETARTVADSLEAGQTRRADIAASSTVVVVAARIDAESSTVGLASRASAPWTADSATAHAGRARVPTGSAVLWIGGEIPTEVNRAAVLEPDRTIGADAFASAAIDGHQIAFTDLATGSAVFQIGLKVDAGTGIRTVLQAGITRRSGGIVLRGGCCSRAAARQGHGRQEPHHLAA